MEKSVGFDQFWDQVANLTDGEARWKRYSILPRFALAMGVKYNDTSCVERSFSLMNIIHQNKQRNGRDQDTMNSNLHVRAGVESKEKKIKCQECQRVNSDLHCHCAISDVTSRMRDECSKAASKYKTSIQLKSSKNKEISQEYQEKKEKYQKIEFERIEKLKGDLRKRSDFCSSSLMKPVYPKEIGAQDNKKKVIENKKSEQENSQKKVIEYKKSEQERNQKKAKVVFKPISKKS